MTCYKWSLLGVLFTLVGCTDTIDSVTREYRNASNEAIDALTMVTDDASAHRMTIRVFTPMAERFKSIDNKLKIIETNRPTKLAFVKEVMESDGFQLYLTDLEVNRQRMSLEVARLRNLANDYIKKERQRLDDEGKLDEQVNVTTVCPNLAKLALEDSTLSVLREQLVRPQLLEKVNNFPNWNVTGYDVIYSKFKERRKAFEAPPVQLVN